MNHRFTVPLLGLLCSMAVCLAASGQCTQLPDGSWRCTPSEPTVQPLAQPTAMDVRVECPTARGSGTSVARAADGGTLVVTNHHVVRDQSRIVLRTTTGTSSARVVATDLANDLSLLHVAARWPHVNLGDSIGVGASVQFRAFDAGVTFRKYYGAVTGEYRGASGAGGYFATGRSVSGNSGGGVYVRGRLVGVVWGNPDGGTALVPIGPVRRLIARVATRQPIPPPQQPSGFTQPRTFPTPPPRAIPTDRRRACDCEQQWLRLEQRLASLHQPPAPTTPPTPAESPALGWLQIAAAALGVSGPIGAAIVAAGVLMRARSARHERGSGGPRSSDFPDSHPTGESESG